MNQLVEWWPIDCRVRGLGRESGVKKSVTNTFMDHELLW